MDLGERVDWERVRRGKICEREKPGTCQELYLSLGKLQGSGSSRRYSDAHVSLSRPDQVLDATRSDLAAALEPSAGGRFNVSPASAWSPP